MIERLTYFWGLFHRVETASPKNAEKHLSLQAPAIPDEIVAAFEAERIGELDGLFGLPRAGTPTEIDYLEYQVDGRVKTIRVTNRGISLFRANTPELRRLHRFFGVLQAVKR